MKRERVFDLLTVFACVLITLAFLWPTIWYCRGGQPASACEWAFTRNGGTDDWRYFAGVWEASRVALSTFHEFPSWNPYHCGGIVLFQDPQAPFPGPIFLLTFFWLPAAAGMKTWVFTHLLAGALGARKLVKDAGGNRPEQLLAAALTTACGFCAEHFGGGHLSFTPFLFFPWILWAMRRSMRDARWAVMVAALLALCVYEGATYPLPLMLVGLGLDILLRLGRAEDRRALYPSLGLVGLLFPLLAGLRLLPVLHYLSEHPRLVPLDDQMTVAEVIETWVARAHERGFAGHVYVWPEYGDYIGWVPVMLLACGIFGAAVQRDELRRQRFIDLGVFAGLVWCALGNIPAFSLFGLLHELPIYKSLRVPARFLYPATVMLALIATRGLLDARRRMDELRVRALWARAFVAFELLVAVGVTADLCVANSPKLQWPLDAPFPRERAQADFYQEPAVDYSRWPAHAVRGIGTPQCYVPLEWGPAQGLWWGRGDQFRLDPPEAGEVRQTAWTTNSVRFEVNLRADARLVVNQNHETSWRTSRGEIDRAQSVLTVRAPRGRYTLELRHRARGLATGAVMTLVGLMLSIAVAWRMTPERVDVLRARVRRVLCKPDDGG
jgi:hypothetical protein